MSRTSPCKALLNGLPPGAYLASRLVNTIAGQNANLCKQTGPGGLKVFCLIQVILQTVQNQGRGLFAQGSLRKGQELLQIPEALLLTAEKASKECRLGELLKHAELPDWTILATYLVQLLEENQQNSSGVWNPYMAMLPAQTGCILEWTAREV